MLPLRTNKAMLLTAGNVETGSIKEALERKKYAPKVRHHLRMTKKDFDNVDWKAHADALKKVDNTSLRKLLWEQHPTRVRQKRTKQHKSAMCPLCDEIDDSDHFMKCQVVNDSPLYKRTQEKYRQRAKKIGVPDHPINHTNGLMNGIEWAPGRYPKKVRHIYVRQRAKGWKHLL